ncbi:serine/threonine protein phosphatase [Candidatus Dependentiae bacterium]|jgi:hypothetical protein|nr:serine/threonine protein phosphatase [Candidatus Dependentiae bacterium]
MLSRIFDKQKVFLWIVLLLVVFLSSAVVYAHDLSMLSNFEQVLMQQPERVSFKRHKSLRPIFSQQEFLALIKKCIPVLTENLCSQQKWLHRRMTPSKQNVSASNYFLPYVQKTIVSPASEIALWGDLHGSAHSLVRCLKHLCALGYLCDDFSIAQDHPYFYLTFLGDYVDRGAYSLEVLYLLMKLKIANPERVFIVRGNHENVAVNRIWGFGQEAHVKYGSGCDISAIERFFNLLPMANYIGCKNDQGEQDFILCCHGGPDVGFDPSELLLGSEKIEFQKIEELKYKSFFGKKIESLQFGTRQQQDFVLTKNKALKKGMRWIDEKNMSPDLWLKKFGFLWHDFDVYAQDPDALRMTRSWTLGKNITRALLDCKNRSVGVHAVMRGHQHHGKLYQELVENKGLVRSWGGLVNTLFSATASTTFCSTEQHVPCDFLFDSFVVIKTASPNFEEWSYSHWWHACQSKSWNCEQGLVKE